GLHSMLQTVRIPLNLFTGATLGSIRGVRLTFDKTGSGTIMVAEIRAAGSADDAVALKSPAMVVAPSAPVTQTAPLPQTTWAAGEVVAVQPALEPAGWWEVELRSTTPLPVQDAPAVLHIGDSDARGRRHPDGDLSHAFFLLSPEQLAALNGGEKVTLDHG